MATVNNETMPMTGLQRKPLDKFYTKSEIALQCIQQFKAHVNVTDNDLVVEPSAGNGSFSNVLIHEFKHVRSYDIEPEHPLILQQDFLELDVTALSQSFPNIHVIGNPPFGRQSGHAKRFIKKCSTFANTISFILPKSFKKESMQNAFPLQYHLKHEHDIETNSFLIDSKEHNVPCIFQVWIRLSIPRSIQNYTMPNCVTFVSKDDVPDIAFRRVGFYAGKICDQNIDNKSAQSHYFLKFSENKYKELFIEKMKLLSFTFNNTVGPRSVSKKELIKVLAEIFINET
jgi:predicted RNA methylase